VVVFDEAHHCDGNHVYAELLDMIHLIPDQRRPRILGLTASPFNAKRLEQGCGMMDPIHLKKDKRLSRIIAQDNISFMLTGLEFPVILSGATIYPGKILPQFSPHVTRVPDPDPH
jgi:hypothetical protein